MTKVIYMSANLSAVNYTIIYKPPEQVWQDYAQIGFLAGLTLLGLPINIYSLHKVVTKLKEHRQQHISMLLIKANLSVANLFILIFYSFGRMLWLCTYRWIAGDFLCRLNKYLHMISICASSNLVCVVAAHRWISVKNVRRIASNSSVMDRKLRCLIILAYAFAALCSSPQFFVWHTVVPFRFYPNWEQCVTVWTMRRPNSTADTVLESAYSIFYVTVSFYAPFLTILILYICITVHLRTVQHEIEFDSSPALMNKQQLEAREDHRSCSTTLTTNISQSKRSSSAVPISRNSFLLSPSKYLSFLTINRKNGINKRIWNESTVLDDLAPDESADLRLVAAEIKLSGAKQHTKSKLTYLRNRNKNPSLITLKKAKKATLRKSAYIILSYICCWFPYYLVAFVDFFSPLNIHPAIQTVLYDLIIVDAVIKPFIYGI